MANYQYGLYPWTWDATMSTHRPPEGSASVLDLRPVPEQSRFGQSAGWGFFAWSGDRPSDAIDLGTGDCRELQPTIGQRNELRIRLGLSANPEGATLVDCLADVFGDKSDPTGEAGPKPILPSDGSYEIHLPGHSRVWALAYNGVEILSANPRGRANKVRERIRLDIKEALDTGGSELAAKVLGHTLRRHGYSDDEVRGGASGRRGEWTRLMRPADLLRAGGNAFRPKRPATSYSDSFTRADASTLGAAWSVYLATTEFGISLSRCIGGKSGTWGAGVIESARYNSDVSSADHWTSATITAYDVGGGDAWLGVMSRFSASAHTGYYWAHVSRSSGLSNRLSKVVGGTETTLVTPSMTNASGDVVQCRCSGSTISGRTNAVQQASVTDTTITGHTRGGLVYRSVYMAFRPFWDDWSIDDGISAGAQQPALFHSHYQNQGWR